MQTKIIKYIKILMMIIIVISALTVRVHANDIGTIMGEANEFINKGSGTSGHEGEIADAVIPIGQILVHVGGWVLVIATVIMGIKYIISTPNERAKLKTQLIGLVVATFVIFGAQAIWAALVAVLE